MLVRGVVTSLVGLSGAVTAVALNDDGTRRSLQFWSRVGPLYAHYRFYQLLNRDLKLISDEYADARYDELNEK
jgi:hypothetical protein